MRKYSKSNQPLDKAKEAAEKEWLDNQPKSQHFAIGTGIIYGDRKGIIESILYCKCSDRRTVLRIRWEDGTMGSLEPFALNRTRHDH